MRSRVALHSRTCSTANQPLPNDWVDSRPTSHQATEHQVGSAPLRCVDAEQPDDVGLVADLDIDRVAVDGSGDDGRLECAAAIGASQPPPPERGGGEDRHDHGPGTDHAPTVALGWDTERTAGA